MNWITLALVGETIWLATIYGKRFFDALDRAETRLDAAMEDEMADAYDRYLAGADDGLSE